MYSSLMKRHLGILKDKLGDCYFDNISLYFLLRLPAYSIFRVFFDFKFSILKKISYFGYSIITIIYDFVSYIIGPSAKKELAIIKSSKYIIIADHNRIMFNDMFLSLYQKLDSCCILTINKSNYQYFKNKNISVYLNKRINNKFLSIDFLKNTVPSFNKLFREIGIIPFIYLLKYLVTSSKNFALYKEIIRDGKLKAVINLHDIHWNENLITTLANNLNIKTFSIQHGTVNNTDLWQPIFSNKIFVWGEKAEKELLKLNVHKEQIVISGNPFFDNIYANYVTNKKEMIDTVKKAFSLQKEKLLISCFVTNWGTAENKGLAETICALNGVNAEIIIKFKPGLGKKQKSEYKKWLSKITRNKLLFDENYDSNKIYAASDIIITCHSSAAIDAMAFNCVSIIIDKFEYMNLKNTLPHYEECIVVDSKDKLKAIVIKLVNNQSKLQEIKNNNIRTSKKYLYAPTDKWCATQMISEHIKLLV